MFKCIQYNLFLLSKLVYLVICSLGCKWLVGFKHQRARIYVQFNSY